MNWKRKVMIIGAIGAGKSSLALALFGDPGQAAKTQALEFRDWIIDTPGEYSENPFHYRSLMVTAMEAGLLMMVQDATRDRNYFPPGFSSGFPIPAIGVITKCDHPAANVPLAKELLRQSLIEGEIFVTSAATGEGIAELKAKLESLLQ
jgi:ethanolamine utilization protein EutP